MPIICIKRFTSRIFHCHQNRIITFVLQWQQLHDILLRTTDTERKETEQSEAQRRQRLREASDELQRGWSDNEHDKVSLLNNFIET